MIFISRGKNLGCYEAMVGNTILRLIERDTWSWRFQKYLSVEYYWLHTRYRWLGSSRLRPNNSVRGYTNWITDISILMEVTAISVSKAK